MTELTKAKLLLAKATDTAIDAAEKACIALAKDFIAAKPKLALSWDQATHARFLLWTLGLDGLDSADRKAYPTEADADKAVQEAIAGSELASMDNVTRAIFALRVGNASQFRQILEKAGLLAKAEDLGDYA